MPPIEVYGSDLGKFLACLSFLMYPSEFKAVFILAGIFYLVLIFILRRKCLIVLTLS